MTPVVHRIHRIRSWAARHLLQPATVELLRIRADGDGPAGPGYALLGTAAREGPEQER